MTTPDEALAALFGRYGEEYRLPDAVEGETSDEAVQILADATGWTFDAVLDLDYIDLLEGMARAKVRAEAASLRLHAMATGRTDLLRSMREARPTAAGRHLRLVFPSEAA